MHAKNLDLSLQNMADESISQGAREAESAVENPTPSKSEDWKTSVAEAAERYQIEGEVQRHGCSVRIRYSTYFM